MVGLHAAADGSAHVVEDVILVGVLLAHDAGLHKAGLGHVGLVGNDEGIFPDGELILRADLDNILAPLLHAIVGEGTHAGVDPPVLRGGGGAGGRQPLRAAHGTHPQVGHRGGLDVHVGAGGMGIVLVGVHVEHEDLAAFLIDTAVGVLPLGVIVLVRRVDVGIPCLDDLGLVIALDEVDLVAVGRGTGAHLLVVVAVLGLDLGIDLGRGGAGGKHHAGGIGALSVVHTAQRVLDVPPAPEASPVRAGVRPVEDGRHGGVALGVHAGGGKLVHRHRRDHNVGGVGADVHGKGAVGGVVDALHLVALAAALKVGVHLDAGVVAHGLDGQGILLQLQPPMDGIGAVGLGIGVDRDGVGLAGGHSGVDARDMQMVGTNYRALGERVIDQTALGVGDDQIGILVVGHSQIQIALQVADKLIDHIVAGGRLREELIGAGASRLCPLIPVAVVILVIVDLQPAFQLGGLGIDPVLQNVLLVLGLHSCLHRGVQIGLQIGLDLGVQGGVQSLVLGLRQGLADLSGLPCGKSVVAVGHAKVRTLAVLGGGVALLLRSGGHSCRLGTGGGAGILVLDLLGSKAGQEGSCHILAHGVLDAGGIDGIKVVDLVDAEGRKHLEDELHGAAAAEGGIHGGRHLVAAGESLDQSAGQVVDLPVVVGVVHPTGEDAALVHAYTAALGHQRGTVAVLVEDIAILVHRDVHQVLGPGLAVLGAGVRGLGLDLHVGPRVGCHLGDSGVGGQNLELQPELLGRQLLHAVHDLTAEGIDHYGDGLVGAVGILIRSNIDALGVGAVALGGVARSAHGSGVAVAAGHGAIVDEDVLYRVVLRCDSHLQRGLNAVGHDQLIGVGRALGLVRQTILNVVGHRGLLYGRILGIVQAIPLEATGDALDTHVVLVPAQQDQQMGDLAVLRLDVYGYVHTVIHHIPDILVSQIYGPVSVVVGPIAGGHAGIHKHRAAVDDAVGQTVDAEPLGGILLNVDLGKLVGGGDTDPGRGGLPALG